MLLKKIQTLHDIRQKSRNAQFGCSFDKKSFYFFNIGIYEWVCKMEFEAETEAVLEPSSYFLDPESLRQICEIFTEGDVSLVREGNSLVMSQGTQLFSMAISKQEEKMVKPPNTNGKPFISLGTVADDVVNMTKMPLKGNMNMESLLVLHPDLVARQSSSLVALNRKVNWAWFPKEPVLYIEAEVIRYLVKPTLAYNGSCFRLVSGGVSLVLPKSEPHDTYHYSEGFKSFKDEHCKDHIHVSTKSIVDVTDLVTKLFSDKPTLSGLKFEATDDGFHIECGDSVALFTHTIHCESEMVPGFIFHVNSRLLSNLKHVDVEMLYIQFCYRKNVPVQMVLFSDLDKGYDKSDFACAVSVQNKT